jgi:hypothetical protein
MYRIIKSDTSTPLNPTKIVIRGKSLFQLAFAEIFRKSGMGIASRNIIHCAPGDEIMVFHDSLIGESIRKKKLRFRSLRGDDIIVPVEGVNNPLKPAKELVNIVIEYLKESYLFLANADPVVIQEIEKIQSYPDIKVMYISLNPAENKSSFLYDSPEESFFVFKRIFTEITLPDKISPVKRLTSSNIINELFEAIEDQYKLKWDIPDKKFIYQLPPNKIKSLITPIIMSNRGFIRSQYPDMIIPDVAPYKIIKLIENIGRSIAMKTTSKDMIAEETKIGEAISVEEAAELEKLSSKIEKAISEFKFDVSFVKDTDGYELQSFLEIGKGRIQLIPV